jgi:hypothetical protein
MVITKSLILVTNDSLSTQHQNLNQYMNNYKYNVCVLWNLTGKLSFM